MSRQINSRFPVALDSVGYARKGDQNCEIKGGGEAVECNILPSRRKCFKCLSSIRTILQTDKTLQVNRNSKPPIIKVVQACVPVFMNVATDPEARYYPRPVVDSSGERATTVQNTRLRSFLYCCSLSSSRWQTQPSFFKGRTPGVK
jgi:hypothetical protein